MPLDRDALEREVRDERAAEPRLSITCAADVPAVPVRWLWPGWLPLGKLVAFDGVAGIGKTTAILDLIARASSGAIMPGTEERFARHTVLIGGTEDGFGDTIRPRLDAAAADLSRVHFVQCVRPGDTFTIPRDVEELAERAGTMGATWLHIDSIMGALDAEVSAYSDHEVRRALGALKDAAERHGFVVTFIRHPRKAAALAVHSGGGSVAFSALARVGLFVGYDPHDEAEDPNDRRRVLAVSKSNLARHPTPLAFTVQSAMNGSGYISWDGPVTNVSADELAAPVLKLGPKIASAPKPDPRATERAWLREQLAEGVRLKTDDLKARARRDGMEWHRVKRAAEDEGVSKERVSTFPSYTEWYLPTLQSEQSEQSEQPLYSIEMPAPSAPTAPTVDLVCVTFDDGTSEVTEAADPDLPLLADRITDIVPVVRGAA